MRDSSPGREGTGRTSVKVPWSRPDENGHVEKSATIDVPSVQEGHSSIYPSRLCLFPRTEKGVGQGHAVARTGVITPTSRNFRRSLPPRHIFCKLTATVRLSTCLRSLSSRSLDLRRARRPLDMRWSFGTRIARRSKQERNWSAST